jgi:hypothetical protein
MAHLKKLRPEYDIKKGKTLDFAALMGSINTAERRAESAGSQSCGMAAIWQAIDYRRLSYERNSKGSREG